MSITRSLTTLRRKPAKLLGAVSVIAALLSATNVPATAQAVLEDARSGIAAPIEGSWILSIDRINQGIAFTAIMSFAAGGVALATGSIDRLPPPPISPLYGSWKRTGANRFAATLYFFAFDPIGNPVAMIKTNETLRLDKHDVLVGSGVGFSCDLKGENCVSVPAVSIQFAGKRIIPESAPE